MANRTREDWEALEAAANRAVEAREARKALAERYMWDAGIRDMEARKEELRQRAIVAAGEAAAREAARKRSSFTAPGSSAAAYANRIFESGSCPEAGRNG